jgi:hypothetical protein
MFECLDLAWPISDALQSYRVLQGCPSFDLEFAYQYLIAVRSTEKYPYREEWKCVEGSTCAGADRLPLLPMAAEYQQVTREVKCGPGEVRTVPSPPWFLAFTVTAGDPSKFKMLIPSVRPTLIPPDTPVTLHTDKVDVWLINHNSQATSDTSAEHTYSFVAKRDPAHPPCQNKWSGEGTIEFGFAHSDTGDSQHMRMNGPFAITLEVQQDGTIQGEGTATLTLALEYFVKDSGQCTANGQGTVPLSVSGMATDGKLKLMFGSSSEGYHITASCSGEQAPVAEAFRSREYIERLFDIFFDQMQPLEVGAEDGAEGRLVEDISEQARQAEAEAPGMWERILSIRLEALPPGEVRSHPTGGGPGQSLSEYPPLH